MGNILPQRGPPESGAEQSSSSGLGALGLGQQHPPFNAQYYYPPPRGGIGHGKYFGGTFIMGGDKFEMSQPEAYLFGDNLDLNYLGGRPCPFPYSAPLPNEPMHMLRALVNIRKETLKLVAVPPGPQEAVVVAIQEDGEADNLSGAEVPPPPPAVLPSTAQQQPPQQQYAIEFIFDADVDCTITIYLLCREEILLCSSSTSTTTTGVRYTPKDPRHRSPPYRYKAGIGQHFSQSSPLFNPHQYHAPDLSYHVLDEKGEYNATALYPLVIHVVADGDGSGGGDRGDGIEDICLSTSSSSSKQSHTLIASLEKLYEEVFSLKPLKQKLFVDGLSYLLQEIYGIENKVASSSSSASSNTASNGVNKSSPDAKNSPTTTGHHFLPSSTSEEDSSENSYECVICMSDLRDTLILPCRHLCLCKSCANSLRYQANNCPICRVPFRALLQIKAVKRQQQQQQPPMMMINSSGAAVNNGVNNSGGGGSSHNVHNSGGNTTTAASLGSNLLSSNHIININSQQHLVVSESLNELTVDIPPGFEIVPLVEALNGVVQQQQQSGGSNHQLSYSVPKHLKQQQHSPTPQLPHVLPSSRDGGIDLSPEEHLSEKSLGSADFEAGAAKSKKSKKKSGSSSLESMSNCCSNNNNNNNNNHSAAKFDIDVDCGEGGGGGGGDCDVQHPLEDIVSFRKKSGADEYDIKYFYSNSSPPKGPKGQQPQKSTNRSNHHHHHHHHQPKMYIPVATSAPTTTSTSTDDSTSASSSVSSSGGASGVEGMGVTVQEKTRLLRKSSSKTGGGSHSEQPVAVIVGSGNSSSNGGDHCYRHSQPHSHSHHRQLDQSSQSDDYCAEEAAAAVVVGDEEGEEVVAEVDPDDDDNDDDRGPMVVAAAIQQQHSSRAT